MCTYYLQKSSSELTYDPTWGTTDMMVRLITMRKNMCVQAWSLSVVGTCTGGNTHSCYHLLVVSLCRFKLKKDGDTFRSVNYILHMGTGCYCVCKGGINLYETDSNMAMHMGSEPRPTQTFGKQTEVTKTNHMAHSLAWGKLTVTWHVFSSFIMWENKYLT